MNTVILMGRLVRDPDIRYSQGQEQKCIARYTLAVDRKVKRDQNNPNQQTADFISCIAFGKSGEFVEKFLKKGTKICIRGHITTGHYERDGQTIYTTDVVVDEHEFAESKGSSSGSSGQNETDTSNWQQSSVGDGFMNIPDGVEDEGLPFN